MCCFLAVPLSLRKKGLKPADYSEVQHGKRSPGGWDVLSELLRNEVGSGAFVCSAFGACDTAEQLKVSCESLEPEFMDTTLRWKERMASTKMSLTTTCCGICTPLYMHIYHNNKTYIS